MTLLLGIGTTNSTLTCVQVLLTLPSSEGTIDMENVQPCTCLRKRWKKHAFSYWPFPFSPAWWTFWCLNSHTGPSKGLASPWWEWAHWEARTSPAGPQLHRNLAAVLFLWLLASALPPVGKSAALHSRTAYVRPQRKIKGKLINLHFISNLPMLKQLGWS